MLINSADFQRQFGKFREMAQREPVTVTSYGRESVVLLSATEYKRLKSQDRRSFHPSQLSDEELAQIAATDAPAEAAAFDHELKS